MAVGDRGRIALERGRIVRGENDDCGSEDQQGKRRKGNAGFSDQFKDSCGWVCCNIVTCDLYRICGHAKLI